jgi:hypothetical protein
MKMEKTSEKLYLGVNGKYYQRHELANAFFFVTGRTLYDDPGHDKLLDLWINELISVSIEKIVNADDVPYEAFLEANQKILAVRVYRERNNCTLKEAKDAIDKMQEEMEAK